MENKIFSILYRAYENTNLSYSINYVIASSNNLELLIIENINEFVGYKILSNDKFETYKKRFNFEMSLECILVLVNEEEDSTSFITIETM